MDKLAIATKRIAELEEQNEVLLASFFEFETIAPDGELKASVLDMKNKLDKVVADNQDLYKLIEDWVLVETDPGIKQAMVEIVAGWKLT